MSSQTAFIEMQSGPVDGCGRNLTVDCFASFNKTETFHGLSWVGKLLNFLLPVSPCCTEGVGLGWTQRVSRTSYYRFREDTVYTNSKADWHYILIVAKSSTLLGPLKKSSP